MAQFHTRIPVDLAMAPHAEPLPHQLALKDHQSFTLTALVYDSRAAAPSEVMAGSVTGHALRPDGATVELIGAKGAALEQVTDARGNAYLATPCTVTVPQTALLVPGRLLLSIMLSEGETVNTTVLQASLTVNRTNSDQIVDGGEVIITIDTLIGEIEDAAADAAQAKADAEAAAAAAENIVSYAPQTLTDAEKLQARTNIGAAGLAELPLANVLLPQLNVNGTHADTSRGRTVTVMRNAVTYTRTADNSTGRAYVLTGGTFRDLAVSSSYAVSASNLVEADFIALPECISEAWARRVYLWLYSPDNPNLTLYNGTTAQQNRIQLATRAQGGTIYMDNSGSGRPWGNRGGGFFAFPIASTLPELWAQMVTDRTLAVYYICKTNNAAKDGTLYWGIGVADHDLNAIPDAPAADGTYTLKVTVADGVPTYAWVSDTTGLMSMSPMSLSPAAIADETSDESEE